MLVVVVDTGLEKAVGFDFEKWISPFPFWRGTGNLLSDFLNDYFRLIIFFCVSIIVYVSPLSDSLMGHMVTSGL